MNMRPPGLCEDLPTIGPPPGIDIPKSKSAPNQFHNKNKESKNYPQPSLESLDLELKVTVQDQQYDQLPLGIDYLEPSMNNLIIYNGNICDTSGSDILGIWNEEMKLISQHKGLVENMPCPLATFSDKILVYFADILFLIEPQIDKKSVFLEQSLQAFCVSDHSNPRIVGLSEGALILWKAGMIGRPNAQEPKFNNSFQKGKKQDEVELMKTLSQKYEELDELVMLQNGSIFAKQKKVGEVFQIDFDNDQFEELSQTQGSAVTCWTIINYDSIAFGSSGQIILVQFNTKQGQIKQILETSKEDIHHGLCYTNNQLFSINKNATIVNWNINSGKKINNIDVKLCPGVYSLLAMNKDVIIALHLEKKDFILLSTKLELLFTYKARFKEVHHCCVSPCNKYVAIVQKCGLIYDEAYNFHVEIEIFPLENNLENNGQLKRRKEIENLENHTVQFIDSNTLQYLVKFTKSINPMLTKWNFITDEIVGMDLLVERYKICLLYPTRMVFSFSFHAPTQQQFNLFAPKRIDDNQITTGISVYDINVKRMLKITFQQQFDAEVFGMPNENLIFVLNIKNQIEVWDVNTQCQLQKADCRPSVIQSIKFSSEYLMLNGVKEWIVRDLKLGLVSKTKGSQVQKSIFIGKTCILKAGTTLYVWDIQQNQSKVLKVPFAVYDFCVVQGRVLAIGDSAMKQLTF